MSLRAMTFFATRDRKRAFSPLTAPKSSHSCYRYAYLFAILGNGTACYLESALGQYAGQLLIGKRIFMVFRFNNFTQYAVNLLYGDFFTAAGFDSVGKEGLEREGAERGLHILAAGYSRYGR